MDTSVNPPLTSIGSDTSPTLVVEINGQVDLPDVGLCAPDGTLLEAVVTGASAAQLATATYQWATIEAGPIAGATASDYTVSAAAMDENRLYLSVTIAELGSASATPVQICNAPPQLQVPLSDIVFDLQSGSQSILAADNFIGADLRYSVSGPQASIDEITGQLSVDTSSVLEDELIQVQASNSGGVVSTEFRLSVEDAPDTGDVDTVMFGALTAAGAGGVPVTGAAITAGDANGHWQISNGELVPSAQGQAAELTDAPYELTLDDGARLDVLVSDDTAHVRPNQAEVLAAYIALPDSGGHLLIRDGNDQLSSRWVFPARAFTGTCVIEPAEWDENADPRLSTRNTFIPGLTFEKGTENVTLQGFDIYDDTTHGESEGGVAILHFPRPTRNISVRQNRIHSRNFYEIWDAGDFSNNFSTAGILRGLSMNESSASGFNINFRIEDNWFHDLARAGYLIRTLDGDGGARSCFNRNYIEDCYTNFVTAGYLDGIDILDNKAMHIWAAGEDTPTPQNIQTIPHASLAGFDVDTTRTTQNVRFIGNLMHVGWRRTKLHRDNAQPDPAIKATGVKFNDPKGPEAYYNIITAFNLVVSHGLCMEFSGCDQVDCFYNTLVTEKYNSSASGSLPIYYFAGVSNSRFWNNLGQQIAIGAEDDTSEDFPRSLDGIIGYGYQNVTEADFAGIPGKGLELLEMDELATAYAPRADHYALTSAARKGALGTGLYLNNGGHNAVYAVPVSSASPSPETREVFFDGSAYLEGGNIGTGSKQFTCAARFRCHADDDGVPTFLYSSSGAALMVTKLSSGQIEVRIKRDGASSAELAVHLKSSARVDSPMGWVDFVVSVDVSRGIAQMAFNGVLDPIVRITELKDEVLDFGQYLARIGRNVLSNPPNAQVCAMGQFFLDSIFVDLESNEGYSMVYASDGKFTDWGPDGGALTGGLRPLIYMTGDRTSYINRGRGGAFIREGLLQDVGTRDFDVPRIQGLYLDAGDPGFAISHTDIGGAGRLHIMARPLQSSSVSAPEKVEVRDGYWDGAPAAFHRAVDVTGAQELILPDINLPGDETSYVAYEVFYMAEDPVSGLMGEVFERTFSMRPTGDITVPVLNSPVVNDIGGGDWAFSGITDTGEGILTVVLTSFATAPTAQQVADGENHLGETQPFSRSINVSEDGAQNVTFTGLTLSTVYYAHAVHIDGVGNASDVVSAASFTTSSSTGSTIAVAEGAAFSAAAEVAPAMRTQIVAFPIRITNLTVNWTIWTSSTGLGTQSGFWAVEDTDGYYNRLVNSGGVQTTASAIPGLVTEGEWSNVMMIFTPNRQEVIVDGQVVLAQNNASTSFKAYRELSGPPIGSGIEFATKGARIYGTNDAGLDTNALAVVAGDIFDTDGFANNDPDVRGIPLLWSQ